MQTLALLVLIAVALILLTLAMLNASDYKIFIENLGWDGNPDR